MYFIGQNHIMRQLQFILPDLYRNPDKGANILLRGPSGFGKTKMALDICRYLAGLDYEVFLREERPFEFRKRVNFIDEIHKVNNIERFYYIMDEKSKVFIFATNHDSALEEAFVNRCYEFIFDDYDEDELLLIARESCNFSCEDSQLKAVIDAANKNPRVIKSLCQRLGTYFRENNIANTNSLDFEELMKSIFRIEGGLDTVCKRYIEAVKNSGGCASLSLITTILHVDRKTLTDRVEPILITKGLIKITSKGRTLNVTN